MNPKSISHYRVKIRGFNNSKGEMDHVNERRNSRHDNFDCWADFIDWAI